MTKQEEAERRRCEEVARIALTAHGDEHPAMYVARLRKLADLIARERADARRKAETRAALLEARAVGAEERAYLLLEAKNAIAAAARRQALEEAVAMAQLVSKSLDLVDLGPGALAYMRDFGVKAIADCQAAIRALASPNPNRKEVDE